MEPPTNQECKLVARIIIATPCFGPTRFSILIGLYHAKLTGCENPQSSQKAGKERAQF